MTIYAYIRVSTEAQDLENQRHGVIEYARRHGWLTRSVDSVSNGLVYFEDTASGKKAWRERDLGKLLDQAINGDVLLVSEISRLARSTLQVLEILQVAAERGITVHVAKNNLVMDGSLHAKITATILGLAAEIEREFISARTTEALARRKAEGKPIGRRPGSKNKAGRKLDKHKDLIIGHLKADVHKASIARIVKCDPDTLYEWMYDNGLGAYIKTAKPKQSSVSKPAKSAKVK